MLAVVLGVSALSSGARADNARIALVRDPRSDPRILNRLRAELSALGLSVLETEAPSEAGSPSQLDDWARRVGAFAAVRLVPSMRGVEVWVADRTTGKTVLREVVVGPHQTADEVVALRAVELLRVSLMELELPERAPAEEVASEPVRRLIPERAAAAERAPGTAVRLGPAALMSPGGLEVALQAQLAIRLMWSARWSTELFAVVPTLPARVDGRAGSADLSLGLAGGLAGFTLLEPGAWQSRVVAGGALVGLHSVGTAEYPYAGRAETVWSVAALSGVQLGYRFDGGLTLGADLLGGVAVPRPVVSFAGERVATWGRPLVLTSITLGLELQ